VKYGSLNCDFPLKLSLLNRVMSFQKIKVPFSLIIDFWVNYTIGP
jgi:hypothetical protein